MEVDLVVPELVADNRFVREARWYPVYQAGVDPERTLLIELGDTSFVLVFPAGS